VRWGAFLICLCAAGCSIEDNLVSCPGDVLCPAGSVCDTVHGGCVSPEQATVCVGLADGDVCKTGSVTGYCLDQICIDPGCGNYIVDDGELCDDGNRRDDDGCSGTCLSREVCGDGALDRARGEECDDGNLQSRDGCDSRCLTEAVVWSVDELGPTRADPWQATYDPVRQMTVVVTNGYVWGWNGERWKVLGTGAPQPERDYDVVFDTTRNRLLVIAPADPTQDFIILDPPHDVLHEWDGSTWTQTMTTNAPRATEIVTVYDPVRQRVFAFGTNGSAALAATLDPQTRVWTTLTPPANPVPMGETDLSAAYDVARDRVVIAIAGTVITNPTVHEWNGTSWTSAAPSMPVYQGWSLLYDPAIMRVLAIGDGTAGPSTTTSAVYAWNGSAWSSQPALPERRIIPAVAYDAVRGTRVVFGRGYFGGSDSITEGTSTTWTQIPRSAPPPEAASDCAWDLAGDRLVCVGPGVSTYSETWVWRSTWTRIISSYDNETAPESLTYDPVRAVVVGISISGIVALTGSDWQPLATVPAFGERSIAITYDPSKRQLVAIVAAEYSGNPFTVIIEPDSSLRTFASAGYYTLAYDARNQAVIGQGASGLTVQLSGDTWKPIVGPGGSYVAVTSPRRGSVEFVSPTTPDVERVGPIWRDLPVPPHKLSGAPAIDPRTGELHLLGVNGISRFMLHRRWESSTPAESCSATDDLDTDGLTGCDDPDCWSTCTPACPPLTTCP